MPSPLIHLYVANRLQSILSLNDPDFLLGSIAPDAIHMRKGNTWADKATTHFYDNEIQSLEQTLSNVFMKLNDLSDSFIIGYLIHLYTDHLWRDEIYTPFFIAHKDNMPRAELHRLYYKEMQKLDLYIISYMDDLEELIHMLKCSKAHHVNTLLTKLEIEQWKIKVLSEDLCKTEYEILDDLAYFSLVSIDDFIVNIISEVPELLIRLKQTK